MRASLRSSWQFSWHTIFVTALFITGCRGELTSLEIEDPGSREGHTVIYHPKSPPPWRKEDIPPNSTWIDLELKQGHWNLMLDNDISNSEMWAQTRRMFEEVGEKDQEMPSILGSMILGKLHQIKYGYDRTTWWFERNRGPYNFDKFLAKLVVSAAEVPVNALEIGSFEGASASWMAKHLLLHPDSMLICIDLWNGGPDLEMKPHIDSPRSEGRFQINTGRAPNHERVIAVKGDSLLSVSKLVSAGGTSKFDVIYIDGGHEMQSAVADIILSFRLLKVGGILIVDDTKYWAPVERAMAAAIKAFGGENRLEVLLSKEQMVVRKIAEDRLITPESMTTLGDLARKPFLSNFAVSHAQRGTVAD